jgi:dihydropteroate synthase
MQMDKKLLEWGNKTYLMGILNLTPDSFSGDSILQEEDPVRFAVSQAWKFVQDGADILDIGAESSRPGSHPISAEIELERLLPIVKAIKQEKMPAVLSIDTYKSKVAQACLDLGADWINDIWGLQKDPDLAKVVARYHAPVILMHNRSKSAAVEKSANVGSSYLASDNENFFEELLLELKYLAENAAASGIDSESIILDPGIGFGKTVSQNLQIINHLDRIKTLGYPVLIGPSRKSFIGRVLNLPVDERIEGTAASIAIGIIRGADIVRVHDVNHMARTSAMVDAILRS